MMKNSNPPCQTFYLHANEVRLIRLLRSLKNDGQLVIRRIDTDTIEVAKLTAAGRYVNHNNALVDMPLDQI